MTDTPEHEGPATPEPEETWNPHGVFGFLETCRRWLARHFWELPKND